MQKNVGLMGMLLLFFVNAVLCTVNFSYYKPEAILITLGLILVLVFALMKKRNISLLLSVGITVGYVAYYMIRIMSNHAKVDVSFVIWAMIPILFAIAVEYYQAGCDKAERAMRVMMGEEEDRILISKETGLYNLKALHLDLKMQHAYCDRNKKILSLMEVQVNLPKEVKERLKQEQKNELYREIGTILIDLLRVEDRVYSVEEEGRYGILLICNKEQSEVVIDRMRRTLGNADNYSKLIGVGNTITVDIACLEFDNSVYRDDYILFERSVRGQL